MADILPGIQSPADALLLNIVTVRDGQATVNLKGPIVINRHTLIGKQCIPTNVANFALQHPMNAMPMRTLLPAPYASGRADAVIARTRARYARPRGRVEHSITKLMGGQGS